MTSSRIKWVVANWAASGALLVSLVSSATAAPVASGGCAPNAVRYKVSVDSISTDSTDFVTVAESSVTFDQGGTSPSCIIIVFSALAQAFPERSSMYIEALLDGTRCPPSNAVFTSHTRATTNARTFVCPSVSPGRHTVLINYRAVGGGGGEAFMHSRTTIVHHVR